VLACVSVGAATCSTKPADVEEITDELVNAARELLRVLGRSDFPPNYVFRVFGYVDNWNQFIEYLERLAGITYRKPPRNINRVKRDCAKVAYLLIIKCTNTKPSSTPGGLLRTVAGLLHQFACPTADGEIVDLKTACDAVCNRARAGIKIEADLS
jgi:hypothetical protein